MVRTALVMIAALGCGGGHSTASMDAKTAADASGTADAHDPACDGVVCTAPPITTCVSSTTLATYALPGTCSAGTCSYSEHDRICVGACAAATCSGGWAAFTEHDTPDARYGHTAVWTGSEMIIWGGAASSTGNTSGGAAYDPVHGTWTAISATNAPSDRRDHSAVWTGSKMIVWGGTDITEGDGQGDGGIYDPATDTWSALSNVGAPQGRFGHSAIWTGSKMIVWGGGTSSTTSLGDGAAYDPATGTWSAISSTGAPEARRDHSAVWTGAEMIVWGGSFISAGDPYADTFAYDPATDSWSPLATTGAPSSRFGHAATWTGTAMFVWGGADSSTDTFADGAQLDPSTGAWTALPTSGAPSARRKLTAVWDGSSVLQWGGSTILDGGTDYDTGASFEIYQ